LALQKPKWGTPNIKANKESTMKRTVFVDIKPDSKIRVRFLPPWDSDGMLFFAAFNHYRYLDEKEKRAWACLTRHGTEADGACACCEMSDYLKKQRTKDEKRQGRDVEARGRWYSQVLVEGMEGEGPKLLALSKTTADQIIDILQLQATDDEAFFTDPEQGTWIQIERKGAKLETTYTVLPTSKRVPLSGLFPEWEDKMLNVQEALGLKIGDRKTQLASIIETFSKTVELDDVFPIEELTSAATE